MKIRVTGHGGEGRFPFGDLGPWRSFANVLTTRGHEISSDNYTDTSDAIIANYFNKRVELFMSTNKIPIDKRVLILWEPYVVERTRYKESVTSQFGNIFAPSVDWAERVGATSFKWPQDDLHIEGIFEDWDNRIRKAVMIQGNKFSARKGEAYSLRRKVMSSLSDLELEVFGTNWNAGFTFDWMHWSNSVRNSDLRELSLGSVYGVGKSYSKYRGETQDKTGTLKRFKISIVIENSADFVSEKLFDSNRAGCVTVYVGPNLSKYGLPKESAIICPASNLEVVSVVRTLLKLSDYELLEIAKSQNFALKSVNAEWKNTTVLPKLASEILEALD